MHLPHVPHVPGSWIRDVGEISTTQGPHGEEVQSSPSPSCPLSAGGQGLRSALMPMQDAVCIHPPRHLPPSLQDRPTDTPRAPHGHPTTAELWILAATSGAWGNCSRQPGSHTRSLAGAVTSLSPLVSFLIFFPCCPNFFFFFTYNFLH